MSLLLRNIPAVVVPPSTLPAVTGSGPPISEHHSYFTDANGQLTFGSVDLPGPPSEATATSRPPQKNVASALRAAVAAEETGLAEWLELAEARALLQVESKSDGENVRRDGAVAATAEPTDAVDRVSSTAAEVVLGAVDSVVETGMMALLEFGASASAAQGGSEKSERGPGPTAVVTTLATSTSNSSAGVWNSVGMVPLAAGSSRTAVEAVPRSSTMRGEAGIVKGAAMGIVVAITGILMTLGL